MLNKAICMKCSKMGWKIPWDDIDEDKWKAGYVACPNRFCISVGVINKMPPDTCPFKLEHLLFCENKP